MIEAKTSLKDLKNVHLRRLSPTRAVSGQDCQSCTRRRIRCDRTVPQCQKCLSRELRCPGYDRQLRWGQGIASRGRLAGRSYPTLSKDAQKHAAYSSPTYTRVDTPVTSTAPILAQGSSLITPRAPIPPILDHAGLNRSALLRSASLRLFEHFILRVTPRLQWMDDKDHWRDLLVPLSNSSRCLKLAILGLSATHLLSTHPADHEHVPVLRTLSHDYRQECLISLNTRMRLEMNTGQAGHNVADESSMTDILATMVVLSYIEFFLHEVKEWHVHLRACRAICARQQLSGRAVIPKNDTTLFLDRAVAQLHFFELPASYLAQQPSPVAAAETLDDTFWTFTLVLQQITRYARAPTAHTDHPIDMVPWQHFLDEARNTLLNSATTSQRHSSFVDHWSLFREVVNVHYDAATIYAYQALCPTTSPLVSIPLILRRLLSGLKAITMSEVRHFDHDIFWPLFIAGTELRQSPLEQIRLRGYFRRLVASTGFCCNYRALDFLQLFWEDPIAEGCVNWIEYARVNARGIEAFLLF